MNCDLNRLVERLRQSAIEGPERIEAFLAYNDLKVNGYIVEWVQTQQTIVVITERGKEYLKANGAAPFHLATLEHVVTNKDILRRCEPNFLNGDYDQAVFCAFKIVEERLREKAGLSPGEYGAELVNKVLNPKIGSMVYPDAQTASEHESIHLLFLGSVGWFKNPSSHRTIKLDDEGRALRMLAFANLLVEYVAELKPKSGSRVNP